MADYKKSKEDKELWDKLDKKFRYAVEHPAWIDAKKRMIQCFQYREGDQYTPKELEELKARGQPVIVNNQVAVTVNKLMGDLIANGFRISYRPRNGEADAEMAELLSDINLYIRQVNHIDYEETDMADDGFTAGFGAMEVCVEFDDLNQPEIKVKHEDSLTVFPDPDSHRYDWNEDAMFIARAKWCDTDTVDAEYPGQGMKDFDFDSAQESSIDNTIDTFTQANYVDKKRNKVRLIDIEWKEFTPQTLVLIDEPLPDMPPSFIKEEEGSKELAARVKEAKLTTRELKRKKTTIHRAVFVCGKILEHVVTDYKTFSLVPYFALRKKDGGPYSLIWLGLSMQDAINKRESKAVHLLTTNQTVAERSAILDKDEYQAEIHKPDGVAIVADGALANQKITFRNNVELAQQQFNMHIAAQRDFAAIVGVDPKAPMDTGELRGNAALKQKFTEIGKPVARIFNNLRRTRTILAQVILDRVQNYYTAEKTLLITDDEGKVQKSIELTKDKLAKIKTAQYDAIQVDELDTPNIQQEQFALWMQYLPQLSQLGPFWMRFMLNMSDLREKKTAIAELDKQQGPPPVVPKLSINATLDMLEPTERAGVWQLAGRDDIARQIIQEQPQTTQDKKSVIDLSKAKISAESQKHTANVQATNTPSMVSVRELPEESRDD